MIKQEYRLLRNSDQRPLTEWKRIPAEGLAKALRQADLKFQGIKIDVETREKAQR